MRGKYTNIFYKGWRIFRSSIGSQSCVAVKHGVTVRANTMELLHTVIDQHEEDSKKPWMPWGREEGNMKLTREDIQKYGTEEEKKIIEELDNGNDWMINFLYGQSEEYQKGFMKGYNLAKEGLGA
jgi:hypothetical protein